MNQVFEQFGFANDHTMISVVYICILYAINLTRKDESFKVRAYAYIF